MPLYFLKPVVWNTKGYKGPSGEKVTSGYPKDHGFGHEEWNAAENSTVLVDGLHRTLRLRVHGAITCATLGDKTRPRVRKNTRTVSLN